MKVRAQFKLEACLCPSGSTYLPHAECSATWDKEIGPQLSLAMPARYRRCNNTSTCQT